MASRMVFNLDELSSLVTGPGHAARDLAAAMATWQARGMNIAIAVPHPLRGAEVSDSDAVNAQAQVVERAITALSHLGITVNELVPAQAAIAAQDWLIDDKALTVDEFVRSSLDEVEQLLSFEENHP